MAGARDPLLPDLTGEVVLVTGASGGIGAGVASQFAWAGAHVVVHHHTGAEAARAVVDEITEMGGSSVALQADLTSESACHDLVRRAFAWRGRLDNLVTSAGIQPVQDLAAWSSTAE